MKARPERTRSHRPPPAALRIALPIAAARPAASSFSQLLPAEARSPGTSAMTASGASGGVGQRLNRSEGLVEGAAGTSCPALMAAHLAATEAANAARANAAALGKPKNQLSTISGRAYIKSLVDGLVAAVSTYDWRFPQSSYPLQAAEAMQHARLAAERAARPGARAWRRSSLPTPSPPFDDAPQAAVGDEIDQLFFVPPDDGVAPTAPGSVVDFSMATTAAAAATPDMHPDTGTEVDPASSQGEGPLPAAVQPSHTLAVPPMAPSMEATSSPAGGDDLEMALLATAMDDWEIVALRMAHGAPSGPRGAPTPSLDAAAGAAQAPPPSPPAWQTLVADDPPAGSPWMGAAAAADANVTAVSDAAGAYQARSATALALVPSATASASATTTRDACRPRACRRTCLGVTLDRGTGAWRCCPGGRDDQTVADAAWWEGQPPAADAAAEGASVRGVSNVNDLPSSEASKFG